MRSSESLSKTLSWCPFIVVFAMIVVTGWLYLSEDSWIKSTKYQQRSLPVLPPTVQGRPLRIFPVGDSITESSPPNKSYRYYLWELLREHQSLYVNPLFLDFVGGMRGPDDSVGDPDHEGHSGWKADDILREIEDWMNRFQPDVVLLHIGTNDLGHTWSGPETITQTVNEVEDIIAKIRNHNSGWHVKIYLAEIIGTRVHKRIHDYEFSVFEKDGVFHPSNEEVQEYNRQLRSMVQRKNREAEEGTAASQLATGHRPLFPITMVDIFNAIDADSDFVDSLHPSDAGEMKMGMAFFEAIIQSEWWKAVRVK